MNDPTQTSLDAEQIRSAQRELARQARQLANGLADLAAKIPAMQRAASDLADALEGKVDDGSI